MANIIELPYYLKSQTLSITLPLPTDKTRGKTENEWKNSFYYSYSSGPINIQNTNLTTSITVSNNHVKINPSNITFNLNSSTVTVRIKVADISVDTYDSYISFTPEVRDDRTDEVVYVSYATKEFIAVATHTSAVTIEDSEWTPSSGSNGDTLKLNAKISNFMRPYPQGDIPFWQYFNKFNSSRTNYNIRIYKDSVSSTNQLVNISFTFRAPNTGSKIVINTPTWTYSQKMASVAINSQKIEKKGFSFDLTLTNKGGTSGVTGFSASNILTLVFVITDQNGNSSTISKKIPVLVPSLFIRKEGININSYENTALGEMASLAIDNPSSTSEVSDNIALIKTYSKGVSGSAPSIGFYSGSSTNPTLYFQLYISESEASAWAAKIRS